MIYNGPNSKQNPLYVGSTKDLGMRFGQLVGTINFDHTFTFGLFQNEIERIFGKKYTVKELLSQWFDIPQMNREEVVRKIEKLFFNKLWFKYVYLEGWKKAEYLKLEKEAQNELKPLNPQRNNSEITLDNLLR